MSAPEFRFTPEVLKAIALRARLGDSDWELAGRFGCEISTLDNICAAQKIELMGDQNGARAMLVALGTSALMQFAREAAQRGISPQQLASRCLDFIAKDQLFVAILDK